MKLGSHIPAWRALSGELTHLGSLRFVSGVCVVDAWLNHWCKARGVDQLSLAVINDTLVDAMRALPKPLQRGGKLDTVVPCGDSHLFLQSYAAVYVLVVRFGDLPYEPLPPDGARVVRAAAVRALPKITALTLALPPPDGPGSGSSEGFGVA